MGKLVLLNFVEGDFEKGFTLTLQIEDEITRRCLADESGKLPTARELPEYYDCWRELYRKKVSGRDTSRMTTSGMTDTDISQKIEDAREQFITSLNYWLTPEKDFLPLWTEILKNLTDKDEIIRVIFKTKHPGLQRLPWFLWSNFFEHYHRSEVGLYLPVTQENLPNNQDAVKVLAVFGKPETMGNSTKIDLDGDWQSLHNLFSQTPNAQLIRLDQPTLEELGNTLNQVKPHIFFFAGHSCTESDEKVGKIELNSTEIITLENLKFDLIKAAKLGLKLAIFNSCDGVGIAKQLSTLKIPNIIVMREPIPDEVAHKFLKCFLEKFVEGRSLNLAVRRGREYIYRLESKFPGVSWLPMLWQNPAEPPLTWESLGGTIQPPKTGNQDSILLLDNQSESKLKLSSNQEVSVPKIAKTQPENLVINKATVLDISSTKEPTLKPKEMLDTVIDITPKNKQETVIPLHNLSTIPIRRKRQRKSSWFSRILKRLRLLIRRIFNYLFGSESSSNNQPEISYDNSPNLSPYFEQERKVSSPLSAQQTVVESPYFTPDTVVEAGNIALSYPSITASPSIQEYVKVNPYIGVLLGEGGRYRTEKHLGGGGMGQVYLASDRKLPGRELAIKLLTTYPSGDNQHLIKRFEREITMMATLKSTNIVEISDFGLAPLDSPFRGAPFYVMEYLKGQTLAERIDEKGQLSLKEAIPIIRQICEGLREAHHRKIAHRDLKPDNIFLTPVGSLELVKILDFGIAKIVNETQEEQPKGTLTAMGGFVGTYRYASPEQCLGEKIDQRTDIYSLGVVFYEMLSGTNPYNIKDDQNTQGYWISGHIGKNPQPLIRQPGCENLPPQLETVVMQCLNKYPNDRFANIDRFEEALRRAIPEYFGN